MLRASIGLWTCIAVILAVWIYRLQYFWRDNPEYEFGWLVLILSIWLVWQRWMDRPKVTSASVPFATLLALCGAALVCMGELYRYPTGMTPFGNFLFSVGCSLCLGSIILASQGKAVLKHLLFPLIFFFLAIPIPGFLWQPIVLGLQKLVAALNSEVLGLLGIPAVLQGTTTHLPNGTVGVNEACSGIRSLQSSAMAALFVGSVSLRRRTSKAWLLLAGLLLAISGNLIRAVGLSALGGHRQFIRFSKTVTEDLDTAVEELRAFAPLWLVVNS